MFLFKVLISARKKKLLIKISENLASDTYWVTVKYLMQIPDDMEIWPFYRPGTPRMIALTNALLKTLPPNKLHENWYLCWHLNGYLSITLLNLKVVLMLITLRMNRVQ